MVLRRTLASPVPHFLAKIDAVIMTIPQSKGLEFNDGEAAVLLQGALEVALPAQWQQMKDAHIGKRTVLR